MFSDIPRDSYGIDRIRLHGVEHFDEYALRACLASRERERTSLGLDSLPECGAPPFDRSFHPRFWSMPWSDWPTLDHSTVERDVERIERWYRARGHYDAKVKSLRYSLPSAEKSDQIEEDQFPCDDSASGDGCEVELDIEIEEGQPVVVSDVSLDGLSEVSPKLRERVLEAFRLKRGVRFDEFDYNRTKADIQRVLRDGSYACADVSGRVKIDKEKRVAFVAISVKPGPASEIGDITVAGYRDLSEEVIYRATLLSTGDPYRESALVEAQHAVYALGAFSGVEVSGVPRLDEHNQCEGVVDIEVKVALGKRMRWGVGVGGGRGQYSATGTLSEAPVWDAHLLGFWEHRNFLGGLRKLRFELRPRLLILDPGIEAQGRVAPALNVNVSFKQPSFLEERTTLSLHALYDVGPDPNSPTRDFPTNPRHDFEAALFLERGFWDGQIQTSAGFRANVQKVIGADSSSNLSTAVERQSDHHVMLADLAFRLDLRDNSVDPTSGIYAELGVQQAGFWLPSSWNYLQLTPELRGYYSLPLNMVIAARFGMGAMWIFGTNDDGLDNVSSCLGPQRYRLRGGGPNSNRGFVSGYLGEQDTIECNGQEVDFAQNSGGLSRWEASLELRLRFTPNLAMALFADVGDVSRKESDFRFDHLRTTLGFGLRYHTPFGPLRIDLGLRVEGLQTIDGREPKVTKLLFNSIPGAIHVTFGEAF